jgi:hypothetical protein
MDLVRVTTAFVWFDLNFGTSRRRPPALGHVMVGGLRFSRKFAGPHFPFQASKIDCCDSVAMRAISRRCQLKSLQDER